jgi:hypothetical protein
MTISVITTWEGTPAALMLLTEASRNAAAFHVSLGAKNPRLLEPMAGGDVNRRHYVVDFDSLEAWAAYSAGIQASDWWATTRKAVADAHPNLQMLGQAVMRNAIA